MTADIVKPWWASKTIIGAIAVVLGQGLGLEAEGAQALAGEVVTLVGAVLAIYGRIRATGRVGLRRVR